MSDPAVEAQWIERHRDACAFAAARGARRIALCYHKQFTWSREQIEALMPAGVTAVIRGDGKPDPAAERVSPVPVLSPRRAAETNAVDAAIFADAGDDDWLFRHCEPLARSGVLVLPGDDQRLVPARLRAGDRFELAREWVPSDYASRSALRGHYLEFGVFWGRSFFHNYHRLKGWLRGSFYAFDSFAGLSRPLPDETRFTDNDFQPGAYAFNQRSFEALAERVGVDAGRLRCVPGFYDQSLQGHAPAEYGLRPKSVSVCVIDCDLLEPTRLVLDFITPLLEPGALLYFDDWRLCRASPLVGERAAALAWLKANPGIELVELHRDHWQHQWFICHGQ